MTTASAPRGTGPPVAIWVAVPDSTGRTGATPQAITSSLRISRTGAPSPAAARSAERTAKPSTLDRSNGGTSIGAVTSSASAQPSASASLRRSPGTARGNSAASKRAIASSRDRIVRNWSWSTAPLAAGCEDFALLISMLLSSPQHIGIDRRARRKSFRTAGNNEPGLGTRDRFQREVACGQRNPGVVLTLEQHDFRKTDGGSNLARQRKAERLARPA